MRDSLEVERVLYALKFSQIKGEIPRLVLYPPFPNHRGKLERDLCKIKNWLFPLPLEAAGPGWHTEMWRCETDQYEQRPVSAA